jgi:hypothetical protein
MNAEDTENVMEAVIRGLNFQPAGATIERIRAALESVVLTRADIDRFLNLVGVRELAERYGVSRQAVSNWASWSASTAGKGPGFPEPVARPSGMPVWDLAATDAWARSTGRLKDAESTEDDA